MVFDIDEGCTLRDQKQVVDITPLLIQALRNYRRGNLEAVGELAALTLVQQKLQQGQNSANVQSLHWALCRVLEEAVNRLGEQEAELAEILRLRYFQGCSVVDTAQRLTLSQSGFFYRQKRAIQLLADRLLSAENALKQVVLQPPQPALGPESSVQDDHSPYRNLPAATYSKIFGLEKQQRSLQNALGAQAAPWIITLVGIGGIGKSTLAQLGSRWALDQQHFRHLIWLTFQHEAYDPRQGKRQLLADPAAAASMSMSPAATVAVSKAQVLEEIAEQLGLAAPAYSPRTTPDQARLTQLRTYLAEYPALLVIDNLESVTDYVELVGAVSTLAQPSKILITSRYSVETPATLVLRMDELSWEESCELLTFEAEQRGLGEIAAAPPSTLRPIYEVVGGNPLALKLVMGQLTLLPLDEVLRRLQQARKISERAEYELYHYLYRATWQLLSPAAHELMLTLIAFPLHGAAWEELLAISDLDRATLLLAVKECRERSLLNVTGWPQKVYSMHRLTYTFLMTDVLKWWL